MVFPRHRGARGSGGALGRRDPLACAHPHAFWGEGEGKPSCSPGLQARSPLRGLLNVWGGHVEVMPCGAQAGQAEAALVPVIGREGFRESGGL